MPSRRNFDYVPQKYLSDIDRIKKESYVASEAFHLQISNVLFYPKKDNRFSSLTTCIYNRYNIELFVCSLYSHRFLEKNVLLATDIFASNASQNHFRGDSRLIQVKNTAKIYDVNAIDETLHQCEVLCIFFRVEVDSGLLYHPNGKKL